MLTGSKLASAATKSADVQIACSHLVFLNRDGNLSTKDLANALAPFAERDPKIRCTRPCVVVEHSSLEKVTSTYSSATYARGMALFATLGLLKVWSANSCARSHRHTLAGHAAKRACPQCQAEIWPTICSIVVPCTVLSFHSPRRRSLAHTPKTLERARACPTVGRTPPRLPLPALPVNFLGNVLAPDEIGGDALRTPSLGHLQSGAPSRSWRWCWKACNLSTGSLILLCGSLVWCCRCSGGGTAC